MDVVGQGAIVFLSITGSSYAIWLLLDCYNQKQIAKEQSRSFPDRTHHSARLDWLLELLGSATLLVVACLFLAMSTRNSASDSVTAESDRSLRIQGVQSLPPTRVSFDDQSPDRPIIGADLSNLPITDDDVCQLIGHAPELQWLNLTDTNVTDACLAHLERASRLTILSIGRAPITDSGLKHMAQVQQLEDLSLFGTKITDTGLEHLRTLSKLQELDLQETSVTDAGLKSLQQLDRLEYVRLRDTAVTRNGIRDLGKKLPRLTCELR
jgi:Leucine-rich repeat (LRR) protein